MYKQKETIQQAGLEEYVFGKTQPQAVELEEAVLGAILIQQSAFNKVHKIITSKSFYREEHKVVYSSCVALHEKQTPIDILTVCEELRRTKKIDKIGGAFFVVGLTNKVTSAANIQHHARILVQKQLSREAIVECTKTLKSLYEDSDDIFDLRNELAESLKVRPFQSLLRSRTMNQTLMDAAEQKDLLMYCGPLFSQTEIAILFADTGIGKTILATQLGDAITKGDGLFQGHLRNEVKEKHKVLYIDLELSDKQHERRYKSEHTDEKYEFSELFIRADFNPDFVDLDQSLSKLVIKEIEDLIILNKPRVLIIDNITYLSGESNQDATVAMDIMKKMRVFRLKYELSIIILAHTPKRNKTMPLTINDLGGSKHLSNFAQSVFAVGESVNESSLRYIKQLKGSNHGTPYDKNNVIICDIDKDALNHQLKYNYIQMGREQDHLADFTDKDTQDTLIQQAYELRKEKNMSYQKIKEQLGLKWTSKHIGRLIATYEQQQQQYELQKADRDTDHDKPPF